MENEEKEVVVEDTTQQATEEVVEEVKEEVVEQPQKVVASNNSNDEFGIKKTNKKKPFILIGVLVVLLAVVLYFGYTMYFSPKNIFKKSIDKGYKEIENFIDDLTTVGKNEHKTVNTKQDFSLNVKVNDMLLQDESVKELIDELNKIKLETELGYDSSSQTLLFNLGALYNNKDLIGVGAYSKDSKVYLELKDIFDKYLELPIEDLDTSFETTSNINLDKDDLKYVLKTAKNALSDSLDSKAIKSSSKTIVIDGKKVKTTKLSYGLSQKSANVLAKNMLEKLIKDDKFLKALASMTDQDQKELKEALEEALEEVKESLKDDLETKEELFINFYVSGITKDTVGYELVVKDSDSKEENTISYYTSGSKKQINISTGDETIIAASINSEKTVIKLNANGQEGTLTITKKVKDKTTTYNYELEISGMSISGSLKEKIKSNDKKGNVDAEDEFSIKMSASGMELASITIKGNSSVKYDDKIKLPDLSNSVSIDNLSEEDTNKIMTKIMENKTLVDFITKISGYTNEID